MVRDIGEIIIITQGVVDVCSILDNVDLYNNGFDVGTHHMDVDNVYLNNHDIYQLIWILKL
jgi:hypothetical protein